VDGVIARFEVDNNTHFPDAYSPNSITNLTSVCYS